MPPAERFLSVVWSSGLGESGLLQVPPGGLELEAGDGWRAPGRGNGGRGVGEWRLEADEVCPLELEACGCGPPAGAVRGFVLPLCLVRAGMGVDRVETDGGWCGEGCRLEGV